MFPFDLVVSRELPKAFRTYLSTGTPALVRQVAAADAPRLQEGFRMLSSLARRRHFPSDDVRELDEEKLQLLGQLDGKNYVIWGALNPNKPEEPGIGISRYRRNDHEPNSADVVITIMDRYQGSGAGLLLHACLHLTACRNDIEWLYYDVAGENERFIRHLKHLGAEHVGRVVGVTRLKLPVFKRALSVPKHNASGLKFAAAMRKVVAARAVES